MRIFSKLFLILLIVGLLPSCSIKPQYVGVSCNTDGWCKLNDTEDFCFNSSDLVNSEIRIKKLDGENEYELEGFIDFSKGSVKSFTNIVSSHSKFMIVLSKDNTVVHSFRFMPGQKYLDERMRIYRKFKSPDFDSYIFTCSVRVSS